MARAHTQILKWTAPPDTDVVGYNFRATPATDPMNYSVDEVNVGNVTQVDMGQLANDGYAPLIDADGNFNLGVSALDDIGNESDIAVKPDVPLDFVPPGPPTDLQVLP